MSREAPSPENRSSRSASITCWPRIRSTTRRILRGDVRLYLLDARDSGIAIAPSARRVLAAIVHRDRVADHVGHDRRAARPRAHHVLLVLLVHRLDLLHQMAVDERT